MPELNISKDTLKFLLDKTSGAVAGNGAHPALQCFHFKTTEGNLTVTASDQKNTIVVSEKGDYEVGLDFIVPAARLHSIVRQSVQGILQLSISGTVLSLVSGMTSWDIKMPVVKYPKIPKPKYPEAEIDAELLRDAIKATRKSMADSPMRPSLRMLSIRKGSMTSCDGSRLAQFNLGEEFPREFSTVIPFDTVPVLVEMIRGSDVRSIGMSNMDSHHVFVVREDSRDVILMAKRLSSRFPDVDQMMLRPALENKQEVQVSRLELIKAIDRVRINADSDTDVIGIALSDKSLVVSARDTEGNSSSEVIPSSWIGKDRLLTVNHKYLASLLKGLDSDNSTFFLGEDSKSRKSVLLLKDEESGFYGIIPQFTGVVRVF